MLSHTHGRLLARGGERPEHLDVLAHVTERAEEALESRDKALRWMATADRGLRGAAPECLLNAAEGA